MKKFSKIIYVVLVMVFVLGAVAIFASAEDSVTEPTLDSANVVYGEQLSLAFKVIPLDGEQAGIAVFENSTDEAYMYCTFEVGSASGAYETFPIPAKDYNKTYYVAAVSKNGDTVTYGEKEAWSIESYINTRLDQSPSDEQKALYESIITYGAAAQAVLGTQSASGAATIDESTAEIAIIKKNLSYTGAVKIVYLVDAKDTAKANGEVKIIFTETATQIAIDSVAAEIGAVKGTAGTFTLGGNVYDVVNSNGISAINYRKALYATPVIVDAEGKVAVVGESVNFTPYDYCMDRFNGNYTDAQFTLYKAFLDYGAAVQTVICPEYGIDVATIGGYADEYYDITLDGVQATYRGSEFDGTLEAPEAQDGKYFDGWFNGTVSYANRVSSVKPGVTAILTSHWMKEVASNTNDFDDGTTSGVIHGWNGNEVATGQLQDGGFVLNDNVSGDWVTFMINSDKTAVSGTTGTRYVFEADITYLGGALAGKEPAFIGFNNNYVANDLSNNKYYSYSMVKATTETTADGDAAGLTFFGQTLAKATTYRVRVEQIVGDDYLTAHIYINDVKMADFTTTTNNDHMTNGNTQVYGFSVQLRNASDYAGTCEIKFDNVYVGVIREFADVTITLDANGGVLDVDSYVTAENVAYNLPTPTREGYYFDGWYNGETRVAAFGDSWTLGSVTLTAKWMEEVSGATYDFSDGAPTGVVQGYGLGSVPSGCIQNETFVYSNSVSQPGVTFLINSDKTAVSGNTTGTKYVFEADITYVGGAIAGGLHAQAPAFIGFNNGASTATSVGTASNSNYYSYYNIYTTAQTAEDGTDAAGIVLYGQTLDKGTTYRVRIEQIVGDSYTTVHIYINDVKMADVTTTTNDTHKVNDYTQIFGFSIERRNDTNAGTCTINFDNVYVGVVKEITE